MINGAELERLVERSANELHTAGHPPSQQLRPRRFQHLAPANSGTGESSIHSRPGGAVIVAASAHLHTHKKAAAWVLGRLPP